LFRLNFFAGIIFFACRNFRNFLHPLHSVPALHPPSYIQNEPTHHPILNVGYSGLYCKINELKSVFLACPKNAYQGVWNRLFSKNRLRYVADQKKCNNWDPGKANIIGYFDNQGILIRISG